MWDWLSEVETGNLANDAKWSIIRAGIEIGVTSGLSQAATANALREAGLAFANDPFRALFRELSDYRPAFEYTTRIGRDLIPNVDLIASSKFDITADYGYVGKVTIVNPSTGLLEDRTFRIDSDELLTGNDAYSELFSFAEDRELEGSGEIIFFEYIGAIKNF